MNRLLYFLLGLVAAAGLYGLKLACFDGDTGTFIAGTGPFGPDNAPHTVPVAVRHRIGEQRVRQLAANAAEAKQRLGLTSAP